MDPRQGLDPTLNEYNVSPFAYLGLVDVDLVPKPALTAWDAAFGRPKL